MTAKRVWVFFYGSYMNPDVLKDVGISPERWEVARLNDFDIRLAPLANLVPSDKDCVHGILATLTHGELQKLYAHAQDVLGESYLPEAVLVQTLDCRWQPALCYICPHMEPRPAEAAYVERVASPARAHGFPDWYVKRIEGFG